MKTSLKRTIIIASVAVCAVAASAVTAALALNRRDSAALPETESAAAELLCSAESAAGDPEPGTVSEPATEPVPETEPETAAPIPEPEYEPQEPETTEFVVEVIPLPRELVDPAGYRAEKREAKARAVAEELAAAIPDGTDLERVSMAAAVVADYCSRAMYTMDGEYYATAYGVFVKGEYSCAGATRALGMLLECMGYSWTHVNENLYTHQWVEVYMDGQLGWADGQLGMADYGEFPYAERVG